MAKLVRTVFVRDPDKHRDILLRAGETPAPEYAVLVRNPACWEGGKLPAAVRKHLADSAAGGQGNDDGGSGPDGASGDASETTTAADTKPTGAEPDQGPAAVDTKPAARKTAAKKPARGRTADGEGTGGQ